MKFKQFLIEKINKKQLSDLERFADNLLKKFDIDIEFSRHFLDRINDSRNDPEITVAEMQRFFKKIQKAKGENIHKLKNKEAVLKDLQSELNLPVVIEYKKGEFIVTHKTIMRKKDFKTSNKVVKYK